MDTNARVNCCKALNKEGKPCGAAPTESGLCYFHANPNKARELGRIGGRSKRSAVTEGADPLPVLDNSKAVQETVSRVATDAYSGKLNYKVAAVLTPLLSLQLRAIGMINLEQRVAELEFQLAEVEVGRPQADESSE